MNCPLSSTPPRRRWTRRCSYPLSRLARSSPFSRNSGRRRRTRLSVCTMTKWRLTLTKTLTISVGSVSKLTIPALCLFAVLINAGSLVTISAPNRVWRVFPKGNGSVWYTDLRSSEFSICAFRLVFFLNVVKFFFIFESRLLPAFFLFTSQLAAQPPRPFPRIIISRCFTQTPRRPRERRATNA
jgi:hypothetical protein